LSEPRSELVSLVAILDQIATVEGLGRHRYDSDTGARLALQRLWIAAGEATRRYCDAEGIDDGMEPWTELCQLRDYLAHHLPDEIDDGRLWAETSAWTAARPDPLRSHRS
jgi:uncharacterized protein with HEPN domain